MIWHTCAGCKQSFHSVFERATCPRCRLVTPLARPPAVELEPNAQHRRADHAERKRAEGLSAAAVDGLERLDSKLAERAKSPPGVEIPLAAIAKAVVASAASTALLTGAALNEPPASPPPEHDQQQLLEDVGACARAVADMSFADALGPAASDTSEIANEWRRPHALPEPCTHHDILETMCPKCWHDHHPHNHNFHPDHIVSILARASKALGSDIATGISFGLCVEPTCDGTIYGFPIDDGKRWLVAVPSLAGVVAVADRLEDATAKVWQMAQDHHGVMMRIDWEADDARLRRIPNRGTLEGSALDHLLACEVSNLRHGGKGNTCTSVGYPNPCDPCRGLAELSDLQARLVAAESEVEVWESRKHSREVLDAAPGMVREMSGANPASQTKVLDVADALAARIKSELRQGRVRAGR